MNGAPGGSDRYVPHLDPGAAGAIPLPERYWIDMFTGVLTPGPVLDAVGHTWYRLSLAALATLYGVPFVGAGWGWVEWVTAPNPGAPLGSIAILLHDPVTLDPGAAGNAIACCHVLHNGSRLNLRSARDSIWWAPWPLGAPGYGPILGPAATWAPALPAHNNYDAGLVVERHAMVGP